MTRDLAGLTGRTFDLLVVGGGIYGLIIAADAAQRGLSVALIERADFGAASSGNHLRTIHGGLRYLQRLDFARARDSVRERRTLARIAPRAVRPMPVALPLIGGWRRGRATMRLGFMLDALVAFDRNRDLPDVLRLPAGSVLSRAEALDRFPTLAAMPASSFAVWHDYVTVEADRLTLSWAFLAAAHSAKLANHVEATALLLDGRRVTGVRASDARTGAELEIAAHVTVNATGGALDRLLPSDAATATPMLHAINLVTSLPGGPVAMGGYSPSGRTLFMVPWRGKALFGTWESSTPVSRSPSLSPEEVVTRFVGELQAAFPAHRLERQHVTAIQRGIVPAVVTRGGEARLEGQQHVHDHGVGVNLLKGLISVAGTKYTTARATAEYVTDRVLQKLGKPFVASRTAVTALPSSDLGTYTSVISRESGPFERLTPEVQSHLVAAYGSASDRVERLAGRPQMGEWIAEEPPVVVAQVVWAVRHEMAVTLEDVIRRRTALGCTSYPGDRIAARVAQLMAAELAWNDERVRQELSLLRASYEHTGVEAVGPPSPRS